MLGRKLIVSQLILAGASVDGVGSFPKDTALMDAAKAGNQECVMILLGAGAEVNGQNKSGSTPLIEAVHGNSIECLRILIKSRASLDLPDTRGRTALFHAVSSSYEDISIALVDAGADTTSSDFEGISIMGLIKNSRMSLRLN